MTDWKIKGIYKADAGECYREIEELGEAVTPEMIVDYAQNESTELHKCFEWDDSIAAHKYRVETARRILTLIVVRPDKEEPQERNFTPQRIYVSNNENKHEYIKINHAVRNDDEYQKLLEAARRDAEAFVRKYRGLPELKEIIEVIEEYL